MLAQILKFFELISTNSETCLDCTTDRLCELGANNNNNADLSYYISPR